MAGAGSLHPSEMDEAPPGGARTRVDGRSPMKDPDDMLVLNLRGRGGGEGERSTAWRITLALLKNWRVGPHAQHVPLAAATLPRPVHENDARKQGEGRKRFRAGDQGSGAGAGKN